MSRGSWVTSLEIRRWTIAAAISGSGAVAVALLGNWLYDHDPEFPGTQTALFMGAILVLALVIFSFCLVPLLVRALIEARAKVSRDPRLGGGLRESEGAIRLGVWAVWTLAVIIVLLGVLRGGSH